MFNPSPKLYPRLPHGWPTDPSDLTHEQLDGFGVPRMADEYELDLAERYRLYYVQYLAGDEERKFLGASSWFGRTIAFAVIGLVVVLIAAYFLTRRDPHDVAIEVCQAEVADRLSNPSTAKFDDGPQIAKGSGGTVRVITGTGHAINNNGGVGSITYTCYLEVVDGEYHVTSAIVRG